MKFYSLPRENYIDTAEVTALQTGTMSPADYYHKAVRLFPLVAGELTATQTDALQNLQDWRPAYQHRENVSYRHDFDRTMRQAAHQRNPDNPFYRDNPEFDFICSTIVHSKDLPTQLHNVPLLNEWNTIGRCLFNGDFTYSIALALNRPSIIEEPTHAALLRVVGQNIHTDAMLCHSSASRPISILSCSSQDITDDDDRPAWTTTYFDCSKISYDDYKSLQNKFEGVEQRGQYDILKRYQQDQEAELTAHQMPASRFVLMPSWLLHKAGSCPERPVGKVIVTHARLEACKA